MNKLIIIPGFSLKNKEWAQETRDYLQKNFDITIHEWKHWKTENKDDFSFENEKARIKELLDENKNYVIAKSIGSAAFCSLLPDVSEKISKLIICGMPLEDLTKEEKDYYNSLTDFNADRVIIFQNSQDDHGTYGATVEFMHKINRDIKLIEKDRDDHHYPYYEYFKQFLTSGN